MPINLNLPFFKKKEEDQAITPEQLQEKREMEKIKEFSRGLVTIQDIIAHSEHGVQ